MERVVGMSIVSSLLDRLSLFSTTGSSTRSSPSNDLMAPASTCALSSNTGFLPAMLTP
jgi:hypothetical protein